MPDHALEAILRTSRHGGFNRLAVFRRDVSDLADLLRLNTCSIALDYASQQYFFKPTLPRLPKQAIYIPLLFRILLGVLVGIACLLSALLSSGIRSDS